MKASGEIVDAVDAVIRKLSVAVTTSEAKDGWTSQSKQAAAKYFSELRQSLTEGNTLPPLDIVRGLDHWGVTGGDLLKEIARVTNALRHG